MIPFVTQILVAVSLTSWIALRSGQESVNSLALKLREISNQQVSHYLNEYLASTDHIYNINRDLLISEEITPQQLDTLVLRFRRQVNQFKVGFIGFGTPTGEMIGVERQDTGQLFDHVVDQNIPDIPDTSDTQLPDTQPKSKSILNVYPLDKNGKRLGTDRQDVFDVRQTLWYKSALLSEKGVWRGLYQRDNGASALSFVSSYSIYDTKQNLLGILNVEISLSQLNHFLETIKPTESSKIIIVDQFGNLVSSSASESPVSIVRGKPEPVNIIHSLDPVTQEIGQYLKEKDGGTAWVNRTQDFDLSVKGSRYWVHSDPWSDAQGLRWSVVMITPESDFTGSINQNRRATIVLCILALFLSGSLALLTARALVRSLLKIAQVADALSQGNWSQDVPDSPIEEMSMLSRAFNRMAEQLQASFHQLESYANYDSLTHLLNRRSFLKHLKEAIKKRDQLTDKSGKLQVYFAILFLDLDYFKTVNDSLGHILGDQLLIEVAQRLKVNVRSQDMVARFGGDEFMILIHVFTEEEALLAAQRLGDAIKEPFNVHGHEIFISTSIGIVLGDLDSQSPENFIQGADIALYQAKGNGKSCYALFDRKMHQKAIDRLRIETDLEYVISRQELESFYQPIVNLKSGEIAGFEALIRWNHPRDGLISPGRFISIAEETGVVVDIGWWILENACAQLVEWQTEMAWCQPMIMSVNVTAKQFYQANLVEQIESILKRTGLSPQCLKLEIIESAFMKYEDSVRFKLKRIRNMGIQLSIDDFGTGYSSLSYLHRFPLNTLKIDRSFITPITKSDEHLNIVEAILVMAHRLKMNVIAEGIETIPQMTQLQQMGCEYGQGYLFSRPLPASQAKLLLKRGGRITTLQSVQQPNEQLVSL